MMGTALKHESLKIKAIIIVILAVIFSMIVLWYSNMMLSRIDITDQHWKQFNQHSLEVSRNLSNIKSALGYGGFIHEFKNMVLRHDLSLVPEIEADLIALHKELNVLKNIEGDPKLNEAINNLLMTIDTYTKKFKLAQQLIAKGLSAVEIDHQVKVDDRPALEALAQITHHIVEHSKIIESKTTDQMLNTRKQVLMGLWFIPVIFMFTLTLILFVKKLLKTNRNYEAAMQYNQDVMQAVPDALFIIGEAGKIENTNVMAQRLLGYTQKELSHMIVEDLIPHRFRNHHVNLRQAAQVDWQVRPMDLNLDLYALHKSGYELPVEIGISFSRQDEKVLTIASMRDISIRKKAEEGMRLSRTVFDSSLESIVVFDPDGKVVDINDAFSKLSGYNKHELLNDMPDIVSFNQDTADFYQEVWPTLSQYDEWQGELWCKNKQGNTSPCLTSLAKVVDSKDTVTHYVAIFLDITTIKENEHKLEELAHYDQLTGLINRFAFIDRLKNEMARARRHHKSLALLFIDLDGFKQVNDLLGHDAGDELLIKVAGLLKKCVRDDDSIARFGGDEFAITLYDQPDYSDIQLVADRILKSLDISVDTDTSLSLKVTASIGGVLLRDEDLSEEMFIKRSDQAMYQAKTKGKNQYHLDAISIANQN